jgi:hypothetical protein
MELPNVPFNVVTADRDQEREEEPCSGENPKFARRAFCDGTWRKDGSDGVVCNQDFVGTAELGVPLTVECPRTKKHDNEVDE